MNAGFSIQAIAQRARLPMRKVRYVVDQQILPGLRGRVQKGLAGRPRSFTQIEGYFLACAGLLLAGGVQRGTVRMLMARLVDMPWPIPGTVLPRPTPLQRAISQPQTVAQAMYLAPGEPALVLLGDGVNVRLHARGVDTGWIEPRSLARLQNRYRPSVVIQLDLAPIHAAFGFPQEPTSATGRGTR